MEKYAMQANDSQQNETEDRLRSTEVLLWETKWRQLYDERRKAVHISDEELIKFALEKGRDTGDKAAHEFIVHSILTQGSLLKGVDSPARRRLLFIREHLKDHDLVDVGSGQDGPYIAGSILNRVDGPEYDPTYKEWLLKSNPGKSIQEIENKLLEMRDGHMNLNVNRCVLVDPFAFEDMKLCKDSLRLEQKEDRLILVKNDGLSYLLQSPSGSANVLMVNVDYALINNPEYHQRLAQEIFRVVPDNGLFLTYNTSATEEAKKLFPYYLVFGAGTIFSKSPIPEDIKD
jgi:hypothetical protein